MSKPPVLLAGAGVGLLLVCAVGVAVTLAGWVLTVGVYLGLFGAGLGGTVALDFGLTVVKDWRQSSVDLWLDGIRGEAQQLANQVTAAKLALEARLLEADDDVPNPEPARRAAWDAANITLFVGGDKAGGYSQAKMQSMISSDPWQAWSDFYAANPEAEPVLQRVPGKVGTKRSHRWPLTRIMFVIAQGELPTPPGPPPSVREFTPESRAAEKAESSAGAVVDSVAREVGQ